MNPEAQSAQIALPVVRQAAEPGVSPLAAFTVHPGRSARDEGEEAGGSNDSSGLRKVHTLLRGRYLILALLGLATGGLAGFAGWRAAFPTYFSEGLLRIAYSMPEVREQTDQNEPMPMFEEFMQSQKILMTSRRAMDMAIQDPVWNALNREVPTAPDQYFAQHLDVDIKYRSEMIRVTVHDHDPVTAAAAVTAIVNAYAELYNSQDKQLERERIGLLQDHQSELQGRIDQLSTQIRSKAEEFGTTKLDAFFDEAAARVTKLEAALGDIRLALAGASTQPSGNADPALSTDEMTVQQIALNDQFMRKYVDDRDQYQDDLNRYLANGYGQASEVVKTTKEKLAAASARVERYASTYRQFRAATSQNLGDPMRMAVATAGMSQEALRARAVSLEKLLTESKQEMVSLGNKRLDLQQLQAQYDSMQTELTKLTQRIEVLRAESALGGRLTVISTGEVPISPTVDHRLFFAITGGGVGFLVPAGLTLLVSLARRRYRYADETVGDISLNNIPLLGMLPEISSDEDDQEMLNVAHGIHQLRLLLCARAANGAKSSYLVTSAREGEGKTNLTVALGMSFAAAKHRTLIIDGDFISRRVTRGFHAEDSQGFYEAIQDRRLGDRVRSIRNCLFVLPTGRVRASDACAIDTEGVKALLEQARSEYDTVLVDSGPILGSLEATVLAQQVQGVLLTISRGQHPGLVQHAVQRLASVGAKLSGAVFNRANSRDFHTSAYASAPTSVPVPSSEKEEIADKQGGFFDFGPLVKAVARTSPVGM